MNEMNARRNPFATSCLPFVKGVALPRSPRLNSGAE